EHDRMRLIDVFKKSLIFGLSVLAAGNLPEHVVEIVRAETRSARGFHSSLHNVQGQWVSIRQPFWQPKRSFHRFWGRVLRSGGRKPQPNHKPIRSDKHRNPRIDVAMPSPFSAKVLVTVQLRWYCHPHDSKINALFSPAARIIAAATLTL